MFRVYPFVSELKKACYALLNMGVVLMESITLALEMLAGFVLYIAVRGFIQALVMTHSTPYELLCLCSISLLRES